MFDMESYEGRRLLRHAAVLTGVAGAPSNKLPKTLIHPGQAGLHRLPVKEAARFDLHD